MWKQGITNKCSTQVNYDLRIRKKMYILHQKGKKVAKQPFVIRLE